MNRTNRSWNRDAADRREKRRFEITRPLRYRMALGGLVVAQGEGQTINMGSRGIAFQIEQPLAAGGYVELSISWPALLNQSCPMRLIVFGRVLRCKDGQAACTVDRYEFRTQSRSFQVAQATGNDAVMQRYAEVSREDGLKTATAGGI
jgi:hypothetical protein